MADFRNYIEPSPDTRQGKAPRKIVPTVQIEPSVLDRFIRDNQNLREFVLGYPTDDYTTTPYAAGAWRDFARDGSFACLTWIYQDVAAFEAFLSRYAAVLVAVGTVVGLAGAWAGIRLLSFLVQITSVSTGLDLTLLVGAPMLLLAALALLACYVPARRSLRIDPISALRAD